MITRFVKLTISEDKIDVFKKIFETNQVHILNSVGCLHAEVYQDINDKSIFFTFSKWGSEEDLNAYRNSDLFEGIWKETKKCFSGKPEAWSVA